MTDQILISSSPQIHAPLSTRRVMVAVLLALVPSGLWSVYLFGLRSLAVIGASVVAAMVTEGLLNLVFKRKQSLGDMSAAVTGLLVAYNMPPAIPLYIPVVASVFAIAVVKWSFGGLGANWMNPALAGRVFVFFSWGKDMAHWTLPSVSGLDAITRPSLMKADVVSGPTPLGAVKVALSNLPQGVDGPMRLLESEGMPTSYFDLFLGRMAGSLGEMSALLILLGGVVLILMRIVDWRIPLAYLGSFSLLVWCFDGLQYDMGFFAGDVLFQLLTGGLMLGAFFMATDMPTTPLTGRGKLIFALGCGVLTFVIRRFGNLPEGVSLAIIFMNIWVPLIDRWTKPSRYGASA